MDQKKVSRATLGRLPGYLEHLKKLQQAGRQTVSATILARDMGYGDVQVRKDLNAVCDDGRPRIGYRLENLINSIRSVLGEQSVSRAVIVGAGHLGLALLDHTGFNHYGIEISAAFDTDPATRGLSREGKPILPMETLKDYCKEHQIRIGIITVPAARAQEVCDQLCDCGVSALWSFSDTDLNVPEDITLRRENLALSLAHLNLRSKE